MKLKHGVSIAGLTVDILRALAIAEVIYKNNGKELVITAGTEHPESHVENSRHAKGDAIDCRVHYFSSDIEAKVKVELENDLAIIGNYTVILHAGHHIHIQYNRV